MFSDKYYYQTELHPTLADIHDDALAWINEILNQQGIASVSRLQHIHSMAWSVVAKVEHAQGVWFFKALSSQFVHELDVSEILHRQFPDHCAPFVAASKTKGFLLISDLGDNLFDYKPQSDCFALWKEALSSYSQMQVETARLGRDALSCLPDRALDLIPAEAMPIIERCIDIAPRDGERRVLQEDVEWIRNYFLQWPELMKSINELAIPNALHHGDLHGGNIAMKDKPRVFDWGDSSWSHPFVTFFISADACQRHLGFQGDGELNELRDAYLTPWLHYGSREQLNELLEQVNRISPLVMLLSWAYAIGNKADERSLEWESGLCTWVNEFLRLNRTPLAA